MGQRNEQVSLFAALFAAGEMPFDQVWRNRVDAKIDGVIVHFISKQI